jgi:hypothetical protein
MLDQSPLPARRMKTRSVSMDKDKEKRRKQAANRALAEAKARRAEAEAAENAQPKEIGGPKGPEPTRYGDWERKGIASDF